MFVDSGVLLKLKTQVINKFNNLQDVFCVYFKKKFRETIPDL